MWSTALSQSKNPRDTSASAQLNYTVHIKKRCGISINDTTLHQRPNEIEPKVQKCI